jgi:hypothetical protein
VEDGGTTIAPSEGRAYGLFEWLSRGYYTEQVSTIHPRETSVHVPLTRNVCVTAGSGIREGVSCSSAALVT